MKRTILALGCVLFSLCSMSAAEHLLWNFGWRFALGEHDGAEAVAFDDSSWRELDLPYDYQLGLPWDSTAKPSRGFKAQQGAWFRKSFAADPAWKGRRVIIDFEGLMYYGDVYLNGKKVGSTEYGYCGFECDVTKHLNWDGTNVLAVYTNTGVPGGSRWYTGGGINRNVWLVLRHEVGLARHGIYVNTPFITDEEARVYVQAEMKGAAMKKGAVELEARILDAEGNEIAQTRTTPKGNPRISLMEIPFDTMTIPSPRRWDTDDPYRYTVEVSVYCDGKLKDQERTRFGVRTIEFGKEYGFRLNGRKIFLQGIANHSDFGAVGVAAYRRAIERQLLRLKDFGYNTVRCSHNPYPVELYDLCDSLGILVVDEYVDKWSTDGNCWGGREPFLSCWFGYLQEWVKRDRNHPCIILWSLGNEMQHRENASGYETADWGVTMFKVLDVVLKRYDRTRPSTAAMFPARANGIRRPDPGFNDEDKVICPELGQIEEVTSINYQYMNYESYLRYNPDLILFQSEASVNDWIRPWLGMNRNKMVGLAYWGAIEYWGESDGWPKKGWNYSFFDHTLAPYPTAYLVRSVFKADEPLVHIGVLEAEQKSSWWNDILSGRAEMSEFYWKPAKGDTITLQVFSNCDEVELFMNGRSLGIKQNVRADESTRKGVAKEDKYTNNFLWKNLFYEPGKVLAIGRNGGKEVCRHMLETPGKPVALKMTVETPRDFKADGMDLQYIRLQAVDSKGRAVNNYEGEVTISVQGEATLLAFDNGDHFTNSYFETNTVNLYRGGALAILRSTRTPGKVTIEAKTPGLKSAKTAIVSR